MRLVTAALGSHGDRACRQNAFEKTPQLRSGHAGTQAKVRFAIILFVR